MCLKAHEVQKKWEPAPGDLYLSPLEDDTCRFWTNETGSTFFKRGFAILKTENLITLQPRIWLPRHNQLMELAQVPGISFQEMTYRFHEWTRKKIKKAPKIKDKKTLPPSMEEAWLTFIMETRYHKRWDGNDWGVFK